MSLPEARRCVAARAALAGNPSDGFGGAVVSTMIPSMSACARISYDDDVVEIPLVQAAIQRCVHELGVPSGVRVVVSSTIPRSLGLAGSSAIVIATLMAIDEAFGCELAPMGLARMAYDVEREDLQIAGGWQDQVVQAHGVTALMTFGDPIEHRALTVPAEPAIPLYLAWREADGESSGLVHSSLQRSRNDPEVATKMNELAQLAIVAADAIERRDVHSLKSAIDATFELRRTLIDMSPRHIAAVDAARRNGAAANVAGSGGAVVGVVPKDEDRFVRGMESDGYRVLTFPLTPR